MKKITLGVFTSHDDAQAAITELQDNGVGIDDISYVQHTKVQSVPVEVTDDVATGTVVGAFAGLALTFLALPAYPLLVAGPIATFLGLGAGTAVGALAGGLVEALVKMGVEPDVAEVIETKVKEGSSLVIVQAPLPYDELMRKNKAEEAYVIDGD